MQETGGDSLDESAEVRNAVTTVLSVMDENHDKILKKDDLSKYMKCLGTAAAGLMTVHLASPSPPLFSIVG